VPDVRTGEGSKKRHGDFAIALALGHWASRQQWFQYEYTSIADLSRQLEGHNGGPPLDDDDDAFYGRRHW